MAIAAQNVSPDEIMEQLRTGGVVPPFQPTPMRPASTMPLPVPQAPPAASDDPAINQGMGVPKPPDLSNSPVAALLKQYMDTQAQINAIPKPDPNQLKPRLWERILGGVLGATQLRNPENAGAVASQVVNRRLLGAQRNYDLQTSPLFRQLETERAGIPMAEAASRIPQQNFENSLAATREQREQNEASGRMQKYKSQSEKYASTFVAGSEIEDPSSPTGYTAMTARGERLPFTPKSALTAPKEPKNSEEAYSAASAARAKNNTAEATRLSALGDQLYKKEIGKVAAGRAPKETADQGGYTASEEREIKDRSRAAQTRIDNLEKGRLDYIGSTRPQDVAALKAIDAEIDQKNQQLDAIRQDVLSRRKGAGGGNAGGGKPSGETLVMKGPKGTFNVPVEKRALFEQNGYKSVSGQ